MRVLLCRIFGWHCIAFQFADSTLVRIVRAYPNGKRYIRAYNTHYYLSNYSNTFVNRMGNFVPMTWTEEIA